MPIIYLSPSTQDWNMYVTGSGSEEYNMNFYPKFENFYRAYEETLYFFSRPEGAVYQKILRASKKSSF